MPPPVKGPASGAPVAGHGAGAPTANEPKGRRPSSRAAGRPPVAPKKQPEAAGHPKPTLTLAIGKERVPSSEVAQVVRDLGASGQRILGKFSPSVLALEDGRELLLTNRLAHGSYGKFRLGVIDGQRWAVKELRMAPDGARAGKPLGKVTRETSRQEAQREIDLLRQPFSELPVQEVIAHRGRLFLLMEPMQGAVDRVQDRLHRWLVDPGLRLSSALSVLADAAGGLARMHAQGWVHRDIKPENLFVDEAGRVRLGDLGLAHALDRGARLSEAAGTPLFIAPEIWLGRGTGHAADVWALGASFVELLAGQLPFDVPRVAHLDHGARAQAYVAWHDAQPRDPHGHIRLSRLAGAETDGFGGYFSRLRRDFGPSTATVVVDYLLNPAPEARAEAAGVASWATAKISGRAGGLPAARQLVRDLATPPAAWRGRRSALDLLSRGPTSLRLSDPSASDLGEAETLSGSAPSPVGPRTPSPS